MGAVTPGETLGTLYNIHVGSNKTKQHSLAVRVFYTSLSQCSAAALGRECVCCLLALFQ